MAAKMLIVLFSVLGCALATTPCTDEEANKCITNEGDFDFLHLEETFPSDDEDLTEFCSKAFSLLDCALAFVDRCPNSRYANYLEGMKGHKAVFKKLCDTSNSFRAEYLEHVSCMNDKILEAKDGCLDHMDMFTEGFQCPTAVQNYKTCIEDSVKKCGEKALEVFKTLYHPRISINVSFCEQILKNLEDMED